MASKGSVIVEQLLETLSVRQFVDLLPGHFFVKDSEGVFLETNRRVRQLGRVAMEGKTDRDMPWKAQADEVQANDKKVMESQQEMIFIEKLQANGKNFVTFVTVKAPLFDKSGHVVGVIGHATELEGE